MSEMGVIKWVYRVSVLQEEKFIEISCVTVMNTVLLQDSKKEWRLPTGRGLWSSRFLASNGGPDT